MIQALCFSLTILHIILSYQFQYPYWHFDYVTGCSGKIVFLFNFCILPLLPRQRWAAILHSENGVEIFVGGDRDGVENFKLQNGVEIFQHLLQR